MITWKLENKGCTFLWQDDPWFALGELRLGITHRGLVPLVPNAVQETADGIKVTYERSAPVGLWSELDHCVLTLRICGDALLVETDIALMRVGKDPYQRGVHRFSTECSVYLDFSILGAKEGMMMDTARTYWATPQFGTEIDPPYAEMQCGLLRGDVGDTCLLPVSTVAASAFLGKTGLYLRIGEKNVDRLAAPVLVLGLGKSPFRAVDVAFDAAFALGAITVPKREERALDDMFRGLGYCTWEGLLHDVTSAGIYQKLEELKAKNVKLRWLLIDDGWEERKDNMLLSFQEDRERFPEGLAACIRRCKEEYGVEYVGVWHAFTGYWDGIHPESPLLLTHGDCIRKTEAGYYLPAMTEEGAFVFWDGWHSYLEAQGVDFVKVDNQAALPFRIDTDMTVGHGLRLQYEALEKSVRKHFGGRIIHCMGATLECCMHRTLAVNRNSDDFFPNIPGSFAKHIMQNCYYGIFHKKLQVPDFDMFWTVHSSAKESAVLRGISGGPVYFSDCIGETDPALLAPLLSEEGELPRWDDFAVVTEDMVYVDPLAQHVPLKVFNRRGEKYAVAAFGLCEGETVKGSLRVSDLPGASGFYAVHEFFSDTWTVLSPDVELPISVGYEEVCLYHLYPLRNGEARISHAALYAAVAEEKDTELRPFPGE